MDMSVIPGGATPAPQQGSNPGVKPEAPASAETKPAPAKKRDPFAPDWDYGADDTPEAKGPQDEPAEADEDGDKGGTEKAEQEPKKRKIKIDDEEIEVDDAELERGYQKARAANKRFEEAAKLRKEAEAKEQRVSQFLEALEADPAAIVTKILGRDKFIEIAENALWQHIQKQKQYEGLPEHVVKELHEKELLAEKARKYEELERQQREEQERQKAEAEQAQYRQKWEKTIVEGLEQHGADLPRTMETVARAAKFIQAALDNDVPVDMAEVAEQVRESYINEHRALFSQMTPEQAFKLFGEDTARKLREYDLSRLKSPVQKQNAIKQDDKPQSQKRARKKMTWEQFAAKLDA